MWFFDDKHFILHLNHFNTCIGLQANHLTLKEYRQTDKWLISFTRIDNWVLHYKSLDFNSVLLNHWRALQRLIYPHTNFQSIPLNVLSGILLVVLDCIIYYTLLVGSTIRKISLYKSISLPLWDAHGSIPLLDPP